MRAGGWNSTQKTFKSTWKSQFWFLRSVGVSKTLWNCAQSIGDKILHRHETAEVYSTPPELWDIAIWNIGRWTLLVHVIPTRPPYYTSLTNKGEPPWPRIRDFRATLQENLRNFRHWAWKWYYNILWLVYISNTDLWWQFLGYVLPANRFRYFGKFRCWP